MKNIRTLLVLAIVLVLACGCQEGTLAAQPQPTSVPPGTVADTPVESPPTITIEEAEQIIADCRDRGEIIKIQLEDGTLEICRPESLNPAELAVVGIAQAITLASPIPGDEVIVGLKTAATTVKIVVIGALITAPAWVPLLDAVAPEITIALFGEKAIVAETEVADVTEGTQEQTKTQKRVAFVEDSQSFADTRIELLQVIYGISARFDYYPTCETLLVAMGSGTRYDAYLVDYYMDEAGGILLGSTCTARILQLHPGAVVIGQSSDPLENEFLSHGAKGFVLKRGAEAMANLLRQLLGLP